MVAGAQELNISFWMYRKVLGLIADELNCPRSKLLSRSATRKKKEMGGGGSRRVSLRSNEGGSRRQSHEWNRDKGEFVELESMLVPEGEDAAEWMLGQRIRLAESQPVRAALRRINDCIKDFAVFMQVSEQLWSYDLQGRDPVNKQL